MASGGLTQRAELRLLGVEIGRTKVRLVVLDGGGSTVHDVVERPIVKAGGPRDPIEEEFSTRSAIEAGLERLELDDGSSVIAGVTIGFENCGVGSGPSIRHWLSALSDEVREPVVCSGSVGVSYAPARCIEFVQRVFEPTVLRLDRVELAPVAASRVLGPVKSGSLTLGSGVAWSARILDNDVLEAFETIDGVFDDVVQLVSDGREGPIDRLTGVYVDETLCRDRGVSVATLAPAVGVAIALLGIDQSNLLDGTTVVGDELASRAPMGHRDMRVASPMAPGGGPPAMGGGWGVEDPPSAFPSPPLAEYDDYGRDMRRSGPLGSGPLGRPIEDAYALGRRPGELQRSREPITGSHPAVRIPGPGERPLGPRTRDGMAGIEAFAHPAEVERGSGPFHVSDFMLGALGMLAIILAGALMLL